jgi:hypothetical protein
MAGHLNPITTQTTNLEAKIAAKKTIIKEENEKEVSIIIYNNLF